MVTNLIDVKPEHPLHGIRAILLDVDGTLVDSNEQHVQAWCDAFRSAGHLFTAQQIHPHIGKGSDQLLPALVPQAGAEERKHITTRHDEIFSTSLLDHVQAFPGARDFVRYLYGNRYQVVLASSGKEREVQHYIRLLDIEPYLTAVTTADDVSRSKPAPDIFAAALQKIHPTSAQDCCVVGDTPYDLIAAAMCRMTAIGLLSGGFPQDHLQREHPRAIYEDVASLWSACKR